MANKALFRTQRSGPAGAANARNEAGGAAYAMTPEHMLAQYSATGCMNATYYASAETQLRTVLDLCRQVRPEFVARTALHARREGAMKDLPALLCAVLSVQSPGLMAEIFDRVIDSPRMLRTFVQIMRSGVVGRTSLGSLPRRMVRQWLDARSDEAIFFGSVGNDPSLADIVKMVHPRPATARREALYGYLLKRAHDATALPEIVQQYEAFKAGTTTEVPDVPFQMLTAFALDRDAWKTIARNGTWQMTRMNLNTFVRHGVFDDPALVALIANRLADPTLVRRARAFPYQLLMAHAMAVPMMPQRILAALEAALEVAVRNVSEIAGRTFVCVDVSGSMHAPVTGFRRGATSAVRCVDVAALVAASVLRTNPEAEVIPFHEEVVTMRFNPRDTVMTNARRLASIPAGGTNCSAPLAELNRDRTPIDTVIYVSDYESWIDTSGRSWRDGTKTLREWERVKERSPDAKMICIDLQPYGTVQVPDRPDILNIGGFSDSVFTLLGHFARGSADAAHWVDVINRESI